MSERTSLYVVWARNRTEAIGKAQATELANLAQGEARTIVRVVAEHFPGGNDYGVNWKVWITTKGIDMAEVHP